MRKHLIWLLAVTFLVACDKHEDQLEAAAPEILEPLAEKEPALIGEAGYPSKEAPEGVSGKYSAWRVGVNFSDADGRLSIKCLEGEGFINLKEIGIKPYYSSGQFQQIITIRDGGVDYYAVPGWISGNGEYLFVHNWQTKARINFDLFSDDVEIHLPVEAGCNYDELLVFNADTAEWSPSADELLADALAGPAPELFESFTSSITQVGVDANGNEGSRVLEIKAFYQGGAHSFHEGNEDLNQDGDKLDHIGNGGKFQFIYDGVVLAEGQRQVVLGDVDHLETITYDYTLSGGDKLIYVDFKRSQRGSIQSHREVGEPILWFKKEGYTNGWWRAEGDLLNEYQSILVGSRGDIGDASRAFYIREHKLEELGPGPVEFKVVYPKAYGLFEHANVASYDVPGVIFAEDESGVNVSQVGPSGQWGDFSFSISGGYEAFGGVGIKEVVYEVWYDLGGESYSTVLEEGESFSGDNGDADKYDFRIHIILADETEIASIWYHHEL